jgi:RNA polymerase sigma-70 factor (ECF subfamily)
MESGSTDPMGEIEAIDDCLRGNGEEFHVIVEAFQAPLMALAVNVLGNRQDAEDACQEAFIQAFRRLDRYDRRLSLKNWLYTILYRRCLDALKRKKRFRLFFARASAEPGADGRSVFEDPLDRREIAEDILNRLSPRERLVVVLWANEGLTAAEIAAVAGCTPSTARVYLFNARKKIKKLMEKGHGTLGNS